MARVTYPECFRTPRGWLKHSDGSQTLGRDPVAPNARAGVSAQAQFALPNVHPRYRQIWVCVSRRLASFCGDTRRAVWAASGDEMEVRLEG